MQHEYWAEKVRALKQKKLGAITIKDFEMTHGMAATEPRLKSRIPERPESQYQDQITALMATLENISKKNNGNTPRLGLYGDMSWDLVNMETDEWILGGDNVYADMDHIIDSYRGFSDLERALQDMQIKKVEFNRVANQLHQENESHRKLPSLEAANGE